MKKKIVILCDCVQKLIPNLWTGFESGFLIPNSHSFPIDVNDFNQDHCYESGQLKESVHISQGAVSYFSLQPLLVGYATHN